MTSATNAMQEEKQALVFLSECLYKVTACLLGPRWASLCGAQTAQGLLCEARKFFSSLKMTLRSPGDPCWYRHVLAKFCAKHNLPLTVCAASSAMHCSAPDVPATMDPVVLNKLLDLFQALVWRFCTEFCNASGVDIPLSPGAQGILQTPQFRRRKLLQFNWRVDRASLCACGKPAILTLACKRQSGHTRQWLMGRTWSPSCAGCGADHCCACSTSMPTTGFLDPRHHFQSPGGGLCRCQAHAPSIWSSCGPSSQACTKA